MTAVTRALSDSLYYAESGFSNQLVDDFGTIPTLLPEQVRAARRYVAGMAVDVEDARTLMAMLGVLP